MARTTFSHFQDSFKRRLALSEATEGSLAARPVTSSMLLGVSMAAGLVLAVILIAQQAVKEGKSHFLKIVR